MGSQVDVIEKARGPFSQIRSYTGYLDNDRAVLVGYFALLWSVLQPTIIT